MPDLQAQDWPNLQKFQQENQEVLKSDNDSLRIVLMGNSITEGWKNVNPSLFDNKNFINRGISGQTTPQMLLRFRQDVIELNPDIVVILAGVNDIAGNTGPMTLEMIINNYQSMIDLAEANNIKIVLSSVLPASDFPWRPDIKPADKILELNEFLKSKANGKNIVYLDYHSAMKDENNGLRKELGNDGVHPNKTGYGIMEPLLFEAIEKLKTNE